MRWLPGEPVTIAGTAGHDKPEMPVTMPESAVTIIRNDRSRSAGIRTLQQKYADCPEGFDIDHLVPKVANDPEGEPVACGLHNPANTGKLVRRFNRNWKNDRYDPLNIREQRPANRGPMGAFDPYPTEHEWKIITELSAGRSETVSFAGVEFVDVAEGIDMETLLEPLVADLDRKAREHEAQAGVESALEAVPVNIPAIIERRWIENSNAMVLMLAAQAMLGGYELGCAANDDQIKEAA